MPARTLFSQPLTRSRLHDEIVALIQKQILTGALPPGTRLPPTCQHLNRSSLDPA